MTVSATSPPHLSFALNVRAQVGVPLDLGPVVGGRRRIVPITGGTLEGPGLAGRVLPGGADWQIVQPDGFTEADARYVLRTDQGHLVYVRNRGMRHAPLDVREKLLAGHPVDPSLVYFCTTPRFETSVPELAALTRAVFVGVGERYQTEVVVRFWRVG